MHERRRLLRRHRAHLFHRITHDICVSLVAVDRTHVLNDDNSLQRLFHQLAVARLTLTQGVDRLLALPAQCLLAERVADGALQAAHAIFQQVIDRAMLQALDRRFFADGARHNDQRYLQLALPQYIQRLQHVELRQRIIGENDIQVGV